MDAAVDKRITEHMSLKTNVSLISIKYMVWLSILFFIAVLLASSSFQYQKTSQTVADTQLVARDMKNSRQLIDGLQQRLDKLNKQYLPLATSVNRYRQATNNTELQIIRYLTGDTADNMELSQALTSLSVAYDKLQDSWVSGLSKELSEPLEENHYQLDDAGIDLVGVTDPRQLELMQRNAKNSAKKLKLIANEIDKVIDTELSKFTSEIQKNSQELNQVLKSSELSAENQALNAEC